LAVAEGVTDADGALESPVPALLFARAVNVYFTPFLRPVIVSGLPLPDAARPLGLATTV
jgi:hypothetical protein